VPFTSVCQKYTEIGSLTIQPSSFQIQAQTNLCGSKALKKKTNLEETYTEAQAASRSVSFKVNSNKVHISEVVKMQCLKHLFSFLNTKHTSFNILSSLHF